MLNCWKTCPCRWWKDWSQARTRERKKTWQKTLMSWSNPTIPKPSGKPKAISYLSSWPLWIPSSYRSVSKRQTKRTSTSQKCPLKPCNNSKKDRNFYNSNFQRWRTNSTPRKWCSKKRKSSSRIHSNKWKKNKIKDAVK